MRINYPGLIDFELVKDGDAAVRFTVHSQHEDTVTKEATEIRKFKASNGWGVASYMSVQISDYSKIVYIQGYTETSYSRKDVFQNSRQRDLNYDAALIALEEWSKSPGIKELWDNPEEPVYLQLSLWD
jgi:hypothetical protein